MHTCIHAYVYIYIHVYIRIYVAPLSDCEPRDLAWLVRVVGAYRTDFITTQRAQNPLVKEYGLNYRGLHVLISAIFLI